MPSTPTRIQDFAVAALIVLSGVSCGRAVTDPHEGLHTHDVRSELVWRTDARFVLRLFVSEDTSSLRCTVSAPSGAEVDCETSDWTPDELNRRERFSTLSFIPQETGIHLVRATTDADELVTSVYVLEAEGRELATFGQSCTWVERFADGAWMCDHLFLREGEIAQPLDVELTAATGDSVWTFSNGRLELLSEPRVGERFAAALSAIDLGLTSARVLLAASSDVFVIHANGVIRVAIDSQGALVETARVERAIPQTASVRRVDASLVIADRIVPFVLGMDPSNPAQTQSDESLVCVLAASESAITETGCRRYPGLVLGESDDGVFLSTKGFELRAVNDALDDGLSLVLPQGIARVTTPTPLGIALFGTGAIVKKVDGALRLQSYEGATAASDRLVWSTWANGTRVLSR